MKTDRIIAFALIGLCFLAVLTGVFFFPKQEKSTASPGKFLSWENGGLGLGKPDIAVIDISGMIIYGAASGFGSTDTDATEIIKILDQLEQEKVKGILFRLNSPGGTASASQAIYDKILKIKKNSNIKVYSVMQDIAASGAYYIASATDVVYSHPSTLTGSIGVIMQIPNFEALGDKIGFDMNIIKSGKYKDIGEPTRKMTDDERQLLQTLINDTYNEFVKAVAVGRKLTEETVRRVGDGRIYTGNQALENKLVDRLGSEEDALEDLARQLNISGKPVTKNYTKPSWEKILFGTKVKTSVYDLLLESPDQFLKFNKIPLMLYR